VDAPSKATIDDPAGAAAPARKPYVPDAKRIMAILKESKDSPDDLPADFDITEGGRYTEELVSNVTNRTLRRVVLRQGNGEVPPPLSRVYGRCRWWLCMLHVTC